MQAVAAEAAEVVAERQSKPLFTSKSLTQLMQQRFMPSLYVLRFIHALWFHSLWDQDVQEQMDELTYWPQMEKFLFEYLN
jgi:hypothetical protein